ncbi:TPA: restriction endonuclease subunit S [Candidatus Campbellbacteria bacterium]|nr:MAG: restriction modification system DNA specificity subunit, type I restriction enzyme, S subunit [Candidatus Campbellbacteria bacterium GW2011_OD1_34_28]KKP75239.1 MAG: Type I restriction system, subunit S [Candidatus Campbellbacteria bacterium GW2011_GWD2_35_24]KKP76200.1 MAG: restriction modification system DNA specificity subunit, type I restriction enzyme, S subunit [Candidatus Campbellbacteria bacterium GW2011_GWC2_35_28]KKP77389.1 MAG: Type I restriction system, subunit S [Candidatus 
MYNWQTKKLGEVCEIKTGKKDVNQGNPNGKYPFFTCAKEHTYSDVYSFDTEAILIAGNGDVGSLNYCNGKFEAYQRTYVLSEFKEIDAKYLLYVLDGSLKDVVSKQKLGNTMPYIKLGMLAEFLIPIPPLSEQKRIVKVLDEIFENIEKAKRNAEKNLKNSKEIFESYLQSVFENPEKDWEEKTLDEVCEISSKLVDPRKPEFLDLIHVGAGNMETKSEKLIDLKTAREEKLISGKFLFDESMVLYSKIRPYLMKVARPNFSGLCSADIYPLVPRKNLNRDYLFHLLLTSMFTEFAIKGSARAGMPKVNREHLFSFNFFLPPITKQKAIVKKLDVLAGETKKLEAIYKQKLADLDELKKSVLKKAFSGEL